MKKQLLIDMLQIAYNNKPSTALAELLIRLAVDPELDDDVTLESFTNEFWSVREISFINQCFNFYLR